MLTLRLDSHMLSDFQSCKQKGKLAAIDGWRKNGDKQGLTRGTHWHMLMEFRGEFKRGELKDWSEVNSKAIAYLTGEGITGQDMLVYITKLNQYHARWNPVEDWQYTANEVGFSKVLWQNNDIRFVYDGKVDLIGKTGMLDFFADHKTQHPRFSAERFDLFPHSNQFIGYAWATGIETLFIDYTVWSDPKTKPNDRTFRRQLYKINRHVVAQWKEETIDEYWEILRHIRRNKFPLRRASCDGKYGICDFGPICAVPDERSKLVKLRTNFTQEERWEPWTHETTNSST